MAGTWRRERGLTALQFSENSTSCSTNYCRNSASCFEFMAFWLGGDRVITKQDINIFENALNGKKAIRKVPNSYF